MKALLILWLKSLAVFIGVVLVFATTQQWDESARCPTTYCTYPVTQVPAKTQRGVGKSRPSVESCCPGTPR